MDVNITTEVKGYGVTPAVSSVEIADEQKPRVEPVAKTADSVSAHLDQEALHGKQKSAEDGKSFSQEDLEDTVDEIQTRMDSIGSKLNFGLHQHKKDGGIVVQITDRTNGELIKQFPSEEILQLQEKLNDLIGLLFDKQV